MRRHLSTAVMALSLCCTNGSAGDSATARGAPTLCTTVEQRHRPPADEIELATLVADIQTTLFGESVGTTTVHISPLPTDENFFQTDVVTSTIDAPGPDREYIIRVHDQITAHGHPPIGGLIGSLVHEVQHIHDHSLRSADELREFLLSGPSPDVRTYERSADEQTLLRECGEQLLEYRLWLYEQVDETTRQRLENEYYTPAEIEAWIATRARSTP